MITDLIQSIFYSLPAQEKRVATEILNDIEGVQHLSISELAERAGVGDATVTRLSRRLSLSGFASLKLELARAAKGTKEEPSAPSAPYADSIKDSIYAIEEAGRSLTQESVNRAVELIEKADRVLAVGAGGGALAAAECAHLFSLVTNKFTSISDMHMQIGTIMGMSHEDVLLLFSYSGATKSGLDLVRAARERGVKTVLISAFKKSPLTDVCDAVLTCGATEAPSESGSVGARMAMLTVTDIVYRTFVSKNQKEADNYRQNITKAIADCLL